MGSLSSDNVFYATNFVYDIDGLRCHFYYYGKILNKCIIKHIGCRNSLRN